MPTRKQWLDRDIATIAQARVDRRHSVTRGGQTLQFAREGDKLTLKSPRSSGSFDQSGWTDIARSWKP